MAILVLSCSRYRYLLDKYHCYYHVDTFPDETLSPKQPLRVMYGYKKPDFEKLIDPWQDGQLLVDRTSRICSRSDPQQPPMTPKPHRGLTTEVLPYAESCTGVLQKTRTVYILATLLAR